MKDDRAVSTIVGAILVLAIMGTALVYVNAFQVPRQGAALENDLSQRAEAALLSLASTLKSAPLAPTSHEIPLRPAAGSPPLLAGIVLTPARSPGSLGMNTSAPQITLSTVIDAPAEGVPSGDPMRESVAGGRMRVYLLGNATAGASVGSLTAGAGGAYTPQMDYALEAGLLLLRANDASTPLSDPGIFVERGATTSVAWRIPILAGGVHEVTGASLAQVGLRPGPESAIGGGQVYSALLRIDTAHVSAWKVALEGALGAAGIVNATFVGAPDNGTVEAVILPPPGTPASTAAVEMRLWAQRSEVTLAQRT